MTDHASRLQASLADRYRVERTLGRGGMATVFLARDLKHDRPVAHKVLHPELAAALGPERFLREIRLCARLQHPHILAVHDSGNADGQLWFAMPYVEARGRPCARPCATWSRQWPGSPASPAPGPRWRRPISSSFPTPGFPRPTDGRRRWRPPAGLWHSTACRQKRIPRSATAT